jgi:putative transposase
MHTTTLTKTALAQKIGVSRQSLYYVSKKEPEDEKLKVAINLVHDRHPAYGHKRLAWELGVNKKRVLRVMKKFNIRPRILRGKPDKPRDKGNPPTATPNIIATRCPVQPNVLWAGDFTYLPWHNCFVYLATVLDVWTREIVGWHVGLRHTTDLIVAAFLDALERNDAIPKIFHSDQGSEYVSGRYEKLLLLLGIQLSNSKKGSPWQNGYQESFYNNFKLEFGNPKQYQTLPELVEAIHLQIHYYNTKRLHTSLKTTPQKFRQRNTRILPEKNQTHLTETIVTNTVIINQNNSSIQREKVV